MFIRNSIYQSDLKFGDGELWAGQTMLKDFFLGVLKEPKVSELLENLGEDVPIGSKMPQFN